MTNALAHTGAQKTKTLEATTPDRLTRKLHKYKRSRERARHEGEPKATRAHGNPMQNSPRCSQLLERLLQEGEHSGIIVS